MSQIDSSSLHHVGGVCSARLANNSDINLRSYSRVRGALFGRRAGAFVRFAVIGRTSLRRDFAKTCAVLKGALLEERSNYEQFEEGKRC